MTDETLQQTSRRPFDLPWNYDRTELRADGVVHAIGLGLALVAVVFLLDLTFESTRGFKTASVLIYVAGLGSLQHVARLTEEVVAPSFRPLCVHGIHRADEGGYDHRGSPSRDLVGGDRGYRAEACLPGAPRSSIHRTLSASRLERNDGLRRFCNPADVGLSSDRGWRAALLGGRCISSLGEASIQNAIWHGFVVIGAFCHYAAILDCVALAPA